MKINQQTVDAVMFGKAGCAGDYSDLETLTIIRNVVRSKFGAELSNAEAHKFWFWRSEKWDAGFLELRAGSDEVVEWFARYIDEWYDGDEEEDFVAPYEMKEENETR